MLKKLILCAALAAAGCGPILPPKSLDFESKTKIEAAERIQPFRAGAAHPEVAEVLGPVTAHSCKYWQFGDSASEADAVLRLQIEAVKTGAEGIIDVSFDASGTDRWGSRCWDSIAATGSAVKFKGGTTPVAAVVPVVPVTPAVVASPPAAPQPEVAAVPAAAPSTAGSMVAISGETRAELLQWVKRLEIPRSVFVVSGPKGRSLDLLDAAGQQLKWSLSSPASAAAAQVLAPVAGATTLSVSEQIEGYQIGATLIYSRTSSWEVSDEVLKKLAE